MREMSWDRIWGIYKLNLKQMKGHPKSPFDILYLNAVTNLTLRGTLHTSSGWSRSLSEENFVKGILHNINKMASATLQKSFLGGAPSLVSKVGIDG